MFNKIEWKDKEFNTGKEKNSEYRAEESCWYKNPQDILHDDLLYQKWFDNCDTLKSGFSMGFIDFFSKILTQEAYSVIGDVRDKTSLEIGFGGGRLINAASTVFNKCYGIDILNDKCIEKTRSFLDPEKDITLLNLKDSDKIEDNSIDFVYSFIVFQHFTSIEYFYEYVDLISRKMKRGSFGNIYFGLNDRDEENYHFDSNFEERGCSIRYKPDFVCNHLESKGFEILQAGITTKRPWKTDPSSQFFVKIKKVT